jgi:hypothetical protein
MESGADGRPSASEDRIREIPKWAQRYARNRTLAFVVSQVIFIFGFCMFGGLSYLTGLAYVSGQRTLAAVGVLALSGWTAFWIWFSFFGAARIMGDIAKWLYRREGQVLPEQSLGLVNGRRPTWAAFVFAFCVIASVGLGLLGYIPERLMQPISAIYVVPFMVYLGWKLWETSSPFMLLWPLLYGIHAILIAAGVPISRGPMFDMLVPTVGYGLLAGLAGHIYSRVALRRLRSLASSRPEPPTAGDRTDV